MDPRIAARLEDGCYLVLVGVLGWSLLVFRNAHRVIARAEARHTAYDAGGMRGGDGAAGTARRLVVTQHLRGERVLSPEQTAAYLRAASFLQRPDSTGGDGAALGGGA